MYEIFDKLHNEMPELSLAWDRLALIAESTEAQYLVVEDIVEAIRCIPGTTTDFSKYVEVCGEIMISIAKYFDSKQLKNGIICEFDEESDIDVVVVHCFRN